LKENFLIGYSWNFFNGKLFIIDAYFKEKIIKIGMMHILREKCARLRI
jgi:hypothetical protein